MSHPNKPKPLTGPVVNSHTEWDSLEEVIVGRVDNAALSEWDLFFRATMPDDEFHAMSASLQLLPDRCFPDQRIMAAKLCLDRLVNILEEEGVVVQRPEILSYQKPFSTPDWCIRTAFSAANPRDVFLVIGDMIIETPMSDRSRYFEAWAYRSLLKKYFSAGARWVAAPKPQLLDELYDMEARKHGKQFVITEFEPCFDAADFVRCGNDIIGQLSNVTNRSGVEWLQRHLGNPYRVHLIENKDCHAIHIDTTLLPLGPGRCLVNPDYVDLEKLPSVLKSWELLIAPQPVPMPLEKRGCVSNWISINILQIDEKRILVEKMQTPLIKKLKDWGFEPIPIDFSEYYPFGGGLHCSTLDIRRRGKQRTV
ncbi:MAG: amidinotransferase [Magnetococcales bacterium]|nr:amidinotransferase [Magnetococcales bacterium]